MRCTLRVFCYPWQRP